MQKTKCEYCGRPYGRDWAATCKSCGAPLPTTQDNDDRIALDPSSGVVFQEGSFCFGTANIYDPVLIGAAQLEKMRKGWNFGTALR